MIRKAWNAYHVKEDKDVKSGVMVHYVIDEVDKGDALLFDGTYTYHTETSTQDNLWNVNMVPTWKLATYGA